MRIAGFIPVWSGGAAPALPSLSRAGESQVLQGDTAQGGAPDPPGTRPAAVPRRGGGDIHLFCSPRLFLTAAEMSRGSVLLICAASG